MRALTVPYLPAPLALTTVDTPSPGEGEVLVRVASSSVNGFDLATAGGRLQGMMEHRFPLVLGKDFAGTVEELGAGVSEFAVGDPVFGVVMKPFVGAGSLAEYVTVPAAYGIARIPAGVSVADAGALGLAGTAALDSLAAIGLSEGETVLVAGASGGVGALAVQYALSQGVRVIATARAGAEESFVGSLNGEQLHVVDYSGDLGAQVRHLAPEGVDAAIHLAGDGATVAELVADGGRVASTLGFGPETAGVRDLSVTTVMADPTPVTLDRLAADVSAASLRVPVTRTYSLDEAPAAFADFAAGSIGKLGVSLG